MLTAPVTKDFGQGVQKFIFWTSTLFHQSLRYFIYNLREALDNKTLVGVKVDMMWLVWW